MAENLLERAKLAEQCERYEDMTKTMNELVKSKGGEDLTVEERNLLSVAYKNVVGARRSSWRIISNIESKDSNPQKEYIKDYKQCILKELKACCKEVLDLINDTLMTNLKDTDNLAEGQVEAATFYLKMKGDYHRYLAEVLEGSEQEAAADESSKAYEESAKVAVKLSAVNPLRLGLALNHSVFHYEIKKDHQKACETAKNAFDEAIGELDSVKDETYKDSTLILQLLRDNLTLWTSEEGKDEDQN